MLLSCYGALLGLRTFVGGQKKIKKGPGGQGQGKGPGGTGKPRAQGGRARKEDQEKRGGEGMVYFLMGDKQGEIIQIYIYYIYISLSAPLCVCLFLPLILFLYRTLSFSLSLSVACGPINLSFSLNFVPFSLC